MKRFGKGKLKVSDVKIFVPPFFDGHPQASSDKRAQLSSIVLLRPCCWSNRNVGVSAMNIIYPSCIEVNFVRDNELHLAPCHVLIYFILIICTSRHM